MSSFQDGISSKVIPAPQADHPLVTPRAVLLGGSLGSGKTTTLNVLLGGATRETLGQYIVIENDIGGNNVDSTRLSAPPEQVLALTAGCICCNDFHSLRVAIEGISSGTYGAVDTVLIEATGIADPRSIKELLHEKGIPALSIITVDVLHYDKNQLLQRNPGIAVADVIVLTWWDSEEGRQELARVECDLKKQNPTARQILIDSGGVVTGDLLSLPTLPAQETISTKKPFSLEFRQPRSSLFANLFPSLPARMTGHARVFTENLALRIGLSPNEVMDRISESLPNGGTLFRVKGNTGSHDIDCTLGNWKVTPRPAPSSVHRLTVISDKAFPKGSFASIEERARTDVLPLDLNDRETLDAAITLVQELTASIPTEVTRRDGERTSLVTESHSGEAWRYVSLSGFPEELRVSFLLSLTNFYLAQHMALQSGKFDEHPALPYYQREVGYNLSWLLIDCADLLDRWNLRVQIVESRPYGLYFAGLSNASNPLHIGGFKQEDLPYLQKRLVGLAAELGSLEDARRLARKAVENVDRLCLDRAWSLALKSLSSDVS